MESGSGAASSAVGRAETDSPAASSTAEHGVGGSSSGAAVPSWRDGGDDSVDDSEARFRRGEREDENDTHLDGPLSDDGFRSKPGRVHLEATNGNGSAGSATHWRRPPGHDPWNLLAASRIPKPLGRQLQCKRGPPRCSSLVQPHHRRQACRLPPSGQLWSSSSSPTTRPTNSATAKVRRSASPSPTSIAS